MKQFTFAMDRWNRWNLQRIEQTFSRTPRQIKELDDIDERDIELVMKQAAVNRARAIRSLRNSDNDIVNAIMSLTLEDDYIKES